MVCRVPRATCLVSAGRVDLHRRLGIAGVAIAVVLVPVSAFVTARAVPEFLARGLDPVRISGIALGNIVALVSFSTFVALATYLRRQPAVHKRLMTLACVAFIGPAVSRINQQQLLDLSESAVLIGAVVVLLAYDVFTRRRPHSATLLAGGLMIGGFLASEAISASAGEAIVAALSGPRAIRAAQPILRVADVGAAIEWYERVLGFTTLARDPAVEPNFAIVHRDRVEVLPPARHARRNACPFARRRPCGLADRPGRRIPANLRYQRVARVRTVARDVDCSHRIDQLWM